MKWELLGWLKYVGYTVLDYQPENVGKHHVYPCFQAGNGEPCIPQYYAMLHEQTKLQHLQHVFHANGVLEDLLIKTLSHWSTFPVPLKPTTYHTVAPPYSSTTIQ